MFYLSKFRLLYLNSNQGPDVNTLVHVRWKNSSTINILSYLQVVFNYILFNMKISCCFPIFFINKKKKSRKLLNQSLSLKRNIISF